MNKKSDPPPVPSAPGKIRVPPHAPALAVLALLVLFYMAPILPPFAEGVRLGSDIINQYLPSLQLQQSILRQGHLPLWNPYSFSGAPLMANMQRSALFYPATVLYAIAPMATAIPWVETLHLFLAAAGMYFLLFEYTRNRSAAMFAAISWVFGGFFAHRILMGHLPQLEVCAYLPALMVLLERMLLARRFSGWSIGLGLGLALTVFAGYPESLFMSAIVPFLRFAAELLHRIRSPKTEEAADIRAMLLNGVIATLIALGLSAIQLLPAFELIGHSARVHTDWAVVKSRSMPPMNLATLAVPDILGGIAWRNAVQGSPIGEMSAYVGVPTLLLALATPLLRPLRTYRTARFYVVLALFALFLALGGSTPLYRVVFLIPGFHQVAAPMRWVFLVAFALPVLAGLSVDALLDLRLLERERVLRAIKVTALVAVGGILAALAFTALRGHILGYFSHLIASRYPDDAARRLAKLPEFYRLQLIELWTFAVLAGATAGLLRWRQQTLTARHGKGFAFLLIAVLGVDLAVANVKNILAVPTLTPALAAGGDYLHALLAEQQARDKVKDPSASDLSYRVLPLADSDAYPDQNLLIAVPSLVGYDPIELQTYRDTLIALEGPSATDMDARAPRVANWKSPLTDRWNVRYVLTRTTISDPELRAVSFRAGVWVYRKAHSDPRAYIVHRVHANVGESEALSALAGGASGFPAGSAEIDPNTNLSALNGSGPAEYVNSLKQPDPDTLTIEATSRGLGLLVVADTYYPGWQATVDGHRAPIVVVNGAMRGVFLTDGKHHIELQYQCLPFRIGAAISAVTLLFVLALLGVVGGQQQKVTVYGLARTRTPEAG